MPGFVKAAFNAVNITCIVKHTVIAFLKIHIGADEDISRDTDGKPQYIYQGVNFILNQCAVGGAPDVFEHGVAGYGGYFVSIYSFCYWGNIEGLKLML